MKLYTGVGSCSRTGLIAWYMVTLGNRNCHACRYSWCPARASDCENQRLIIESPWAGPAGCMPQPRIDELLFSTVRSCTCYWFNRAIVSNELGPWTHIQQINIIFEHYHNFAAAFRAQYSQFYFSLRYRKKASFYIAVFLATKEIFNSGDWKISPRRYRDL